MNAEGLYLVALHGIGVHLVLKEQPLFFKPLDVRENIFYLLVGNVRDIHVLPLFLGLEVVGGGLVALVQGAAAHVVDIIFVPIAENVYHNR